MSVKDELKAAREAQASQPGPQCSVCAWIEAREDTEEWYGAAKVYGPKALFDVMQDHGFTGSESSVKRHGLKGHR